MCFARLEKFGKTPAISSIFWNFYWWKIWPIGFFFHKIRALESTLFWVWCVSELFTYDFDPIAQSAKAQSAMNAENWQQLSQAKRPLVKVYLEAKPWNGLIGHSIATWTRWGGRGSKNVCFCLRSGYKNCPRRGAQKSRGHF